jgi:glycosyltransferase involved in cell wall biosynthesis
LSKSPKISVIIPTLEEEKRLPWTLEQFTRALKNEFNLEIIVSDAAARTAL